MTCKGNLETAPHIRDIEQMPVLLPSFSPLSRKGDGNSDRGRTDVHLNLYLLQEVISLHSLYPQDQSLVPAVHQYQPMF